MKIAHWVKPNHSGMANVAESIAMAEVALGLKSVLIDCENRAAWPSADDADIHVIHTHIADAYRSSGKPLVWVAHGTPEVMFHGGYEQGLVNGAYGHGDPWMMAQFWLQQCDATVTFWPRHQRIWKSLCDKRTRVECFPLGIDRNFWKPQASEGRFTGTPSVFTAENCYEIKWPLDLFLAWPWVTESLPDARLHAIYVPKDQHRWWFPLVNRNGASFHSYIQASVFDAKAMRNAFCSTDYYLGLVRYGDFNRVSLEANACGAKTISYASNPYSDYWLPEGDQRVIAGELAKILRGEVNPREKNQPVDISETASAMVQLYNSL